VPRSIAASQKKVEEVDKTENQEKRLREEAEKHEYVVAEVFVDDDISAYQGKLQRPAWTRMLQGILQGKFDVVMATEPMRLTRGSASELEALQVVCVKAGAVIFYPTMGEQDPATAMTRPFMGVMDIMGGLEVAVKSERQRARNLDNVKAGKPLWGQRPVGFELDRVTIRENEAQLIRDATDAILDGATVYSIAIAWNESGIKTTKAGMARRRPGDPKDAPKRVSDGLWTTSNVKRVLQCPINAGILMHHNAVMSEGMPAIVWREKYDQLLAKLKSDKIMIRPGPNTRTAVFATSASADASI
jgi:DNA invertase Pin-like site-specific DNA recombinase